MNTENIPFELQELRTAKQTDQGDYSRRRFLAGAGVIGITAAVAGCSSQSGTDTADQPSVRVFLDNAPNGLRKFKSSIQSISDNTIEEITPGLINEDEFQVISGGVGETEAVVRAADVSENIESFSDQRLLVSFAFESEVQESNIEVSVSQLTNNDGESISKENIRIDSSN